MMEIPRIIVHDHCCEPLFDLRPDLLVSATRTDEINGEHCLSIITAQRLQQGQRLVYRDAMGLWWEYVVLGVDELHDSGAMALGTYYAVWSPQYDLSTVYAEDIEVGGEFDASAHVAMTHALDGTSRWEVGSVDSLGELTMEMFGNSAWERVVDVTNNYGGELGWSMSYDTLTGRVKSRKLNLVSQLGSANAVRRFDWGYDITSIRRKPQEVPNCCRIIPVGTSDDVTLDGFVIEGKLEQRYLEDEDAAKAFRYPDGKGGYEYPTRKVKLSIDNDAELLEYAKKHLHDYTRPTPTYEASVVQFAEAGMDVKGVTLGDVVHIVDRGFNPDEPLLLEGRVVKVVQNLIDRTDVKLTIGQIGNGFSTMYRQMQADMKSMRNNINAVTGGNYTTENYINWLVEQLNQEMNATGGYSYLVPGEGLITYDKAVVDPLIGKDEDGKPAGSVVQVKGGTIRIANTRKAQFGGINDWNWRTVFTAGHIASDIVTAGEIVSGYIRNADGSFLIDLDNGEYRMPTGTKVGDSTMQEIMDYRAESVEEALDVMLTQEKILERLSEGSQGLYVDPDTGLLYINGSYIKTGSINATLIKTGILTDGEGNNYWNLNTGELVTTYGKIGGFTIGEQALYNGLATLFGTDKGVYVGTNGIASSNGDEGIALSGGGIQGFNNGKESGYISPTAVAEEKDSDGNVIAKYHGMQIRGDVIDLRSRNIVVKGSNTTEGDSTHTVTAEGGSTSNNEHYATRFVPTSKSNNVLSGYLRIVFPKYINGMFVGSSTNYWSAVGSGNIDIPLKAYVDNQIEQLKTWVGNQGYLTSVPAHTHTSVEITGVPKFSQSGNTLYITT